MLRGASGWLGLMRVLWEQVGGVERVFRAKRGRGGENRGKRMAGWRQEARKESAKEAGVYGRRGKARGGCMV